ncbi:MULTISPECIES: hypothetical protein [unclassified Actinoplanes]|uniref:hypothetical protein n=1 Tax=unclassified Actinoplanes TaxID=2626549 RepID=UPI0012BAF992|nr:MULTISPECIES: hypothetical protein [unclassified Actinoplanes]
MVALTACDSGPANPADTPAAKKDQQMQVMKRTDAENLAKKLAEQVASLVGKPLTGWRTSSAACENTDGVVASDGRWDLSTGGNVEVARDDQVATLNKIRDDWTSRGYQITEFHLLPDGDTGGSTSALVPESGLTISVQSTVPRTGIAIIVVTPCYKPAGNENPARGY